MRLKKGEIMSIYCDVLEIPGGQVPKGTVYVSGAKNAATRLLAAAAILDECVTLTNYPVELVDSKHKERFFKNIGVKIQSSSNTLVIDPTEINPIKLDDYYYPIRTTYLLVAAQLKKSGVAYIPYPGGCNIGARGYDVHIEIWESFGCSVIEHDEFIEISIKGNSKGANYEFPISTVGGTENALLMASIVNDESIFSNAYITPEVEDLIEFLKKSGVEIEVSGQSFIKVKGKDYLNGVSHSVLPDRIEALTWIVYAALSGGEILIKNIPFEQMKIPLMYLKNAGVNYFKNDDAIFINKMCMNEGTARSFEVACGTHPGIISDMQPFFVLLGLMSIGKSRIHDYRYPKRIAYVNELRKFVGDNVCAEIGKITTTGPAEFRSSNCSATDLRGTMASIMAALCSPDGVSKIDGVSMALRGYDRLVEKLANLGIKLKYLSEKQVKNESSKSAR